MYRYVQGDSIGLTSELAGRHPVLKGATVYLGLSVSVRVEWRQTPGSDEYLEFCFQLSDSVAYVRRVLMHAFGLDEQWHYCLQSDGFTLDMPSGPVESPVATLESVGINSGCRADMVVVGSPLQVRVRFMGMSERTVNVNPMMDVQQLLTGQLAAHNELIPGNLHEYIRGQRTKVAVYDAGAEAAGDAGDTGQHTQQARRNLTMWNPMGEPHTMYFVTGGRVSEVDFRLGGKPLPLRVEVPTGNNPGKYDTSVPMDGDTPVAVVCGCAVSLVRYDGGIGDLIGGDGSQLWCDMTPMSGVTMYAMLGDGSRIALDGSSLMPMRHLGSVKAMQIVGNLNGGRLPGGLQNHGAGSSVSHAVDGNDGSVTSDALVDNRTTSKGKGRMLSTGGAGLQQEPAAGGGRWVRDVPSVSRVKYPKPSHWEPLRLHDVMPERLSCLKMGVPEHHSDPDDDVTDHWMEGKWLCAESGCDNVSVAMEADWMVGLTLRKLVIWLLSVQTMAAVLAPWSVFLSIASIAERWSRGFSVPKYGHRVLMRPTCVWRASRCRRKWSVLCRLRAIKRHAPGIAWQRICEQKAQDWRESCAQRIQQAWRG